MASEPVILICGALIIIALFAIIYIFVTDGKRQRDLLREIAHLDDEITAERAVRETESVHNHSGV